MVVVTPIKPNKSKSKEFSPLTKLVIVLIPFLLIVSAWGIFKVFGDTIIGLTLNNNPNLQTGLVAHYTFDADTVGSTTVTDASGNGNTANWGGGGGGGGSFTPSDLTNLVYWFDPDAGITLNGTKVSNWSATAGSASAAVGGFGASTEPEYTGVTLNSQQALDFDGAAPDYLEENSFTHSIGIGDFYSATVIEPDDVTSTHIWDISDGATTFRLALSTDASGDVEVSVGSGSLGEHNFASHTLSTATAYVVEVWRDGSSLRVRVNGTLDSDTITDSSSVGTTDLISVGEAADSSTQYDGRMGDLILTSSLPSSTERDDTCAYLGSAFSISVSCSGSGGGGGGSATATDAVRDGKIGQALEYDGSSDYLDIGNLGSGVKTVAFWMRADDTTSRGIINIDGTDSIDLNGSSNVVATSFPAATVYIDGSSASANIPDTEWHHVVVTDSSGVNASAFQVGSTTTGFFDGVIDDVRVYTTELSAADVLRLYQLGATTYINKSINTNPDLQNGLIGHWSFDGPSVSGTTVSDVSSNSNDGTITGAGGGTGSTPSDVTDLIFWMDPDTGITLNGSDVENWEASNDATIDFNMSTPANQQPVYTGAAINSVQAVDFERSLDERLVEPSVTHSIGSGDFYMAGAFQIEALATMQWLGWGGGDYGPLVTSGGAPAFWNGGSNETFSSLSVSAGTPFVMEVWRTGTSIRARINGTADSDSNTMSTDLGSSAEMVIGAYADGDGFDNWDGEMGDMVVTSSLPSSTERDDTCAYLADKYGISASCTASSGSGPTTAITEGKIGQGLVFDGVDDYVNVGNTSDYNFTTSDFTLSMWVYPTDAVANTDVILSRGLYQTDGYYMQYINDNSPHDIQVVLNDSGDTGATDDVIHSGDNVGLSDNEWHHVLFVREGTAGRIYMDGEEVSSYVTQETVSDPKSSTRNLYFGRYDSGGFETPHYMDDARIYNRALSDAEIRRLYQLGATTYVNKTINTNPDLKNGLVGHWTFDGPSMYTNVGDSSVNGNSGGLELWGTATTTVPGIFGQALQFDGTDDNADFGDVTIYDGLSSVSVSAWVRPSSLPPEDDGVSVIRKDGSFSALQLWNESGVPQVLQSAFWTPSLTIYSIEETLPTDAWSHYVLRWDKNTDSGAPEVFLNGVSIGNKSIKSGSGATGDLANSSTQLVFGDHESGGEPYDGALDDVRVYNRYLSDAEITRLSQLGPTVVASGGGGGGGGGTGCNFGTDIGGGYCRGYIDSTSSTTWDVPSDWDNSDNSIVAIGAGGDGGLSTGSSNSGAGGGGGEYRAASNVTLTAASTVDINIPSGGDGSGTDGAWVKNGAGGGGSIVVEGKNGGNASGVTAGSGGTGGTGAAANFDGGDGGAGASNGTAAGGGGGGGSAGPTGAGKNGAAGSAGTGNGGSGGGGSNGGSSSAGSTNSGTTGGAGGAGTGGSGGGSGGTNNGDNAGNGSAGGGGGGAGNATGGTNADGGEGGVEDLWDTGVGPSGGGGGGGGASGSAGTGDRDGGIGGTYGGGGGGCGMSGTLDAGECDGINVGGQGIIVITYLDSDG